MTFYAVNYAQRKFCGEQCAKEKVIRVKRKTKIAVNNMQTLHWLVRLCCPFQKKFAVNYAQEKHITG